MRDIAGIFGWIVAIGYTIAMLNFVLKFVHKKIIIKLQKDKKKLVDLYRIFMKYIIKYHKLIGVITAITVIIHFLIMSIYVEVSISGIISMTLMLIIFALGIYGSLINKNFKGAWLKIHRIVAFLLFLVIIIHITG
jgi:hypothetical protein